MAEQFDAVTPDIGAPDANNPYGRYLDEDAGVPGTPILSGWKNTIKAFMERLIIRTGKTYNGIPDQSAGVAQVYDALDEVITGDDPALDDWAAGTYNVNQVVRHKGKQFFPGVASTVNTPGPNSQWEKSKTFDEHLKESGQGPIIGGFMPLNDIRDVSNYNTYYKMGDYEWYDEKWEAWRLNIDGSAHVSGTSDVAKLLAQYKHSAKVVASDVAGTLTLEDYLGTYARGVDASGGETENVGDRGEDAGQRIKGTWVNGGDRDVADQSGVFSGLGPTTSLGVSPSGSFSAEGIDFDSANSTSPFPAKTSDTETKVKANTQGTWGVTILVPAGTI